MDIFIRCCFITIIIQIKQLWMKIEDIEKELRAQIKMALKCITSLSHISANMRSTGFTPEVKEMAKRVAKEFKLKMVDVELDKDYGINYIGFDFN